MRLRNRSANSLLWRTPDTRGQGLVEFALVLPVMLLILLVAVDFGRLFFTYIEVNNAAREAAFVASQDLNGQSSIDARARQEANVQAQGGEGSLTVSLPVCATAANPPVATSCPTGIPDSAFLSGAGHQVTVSVSKQFTFLTPIIGGFFPAFSVGASATAPVLPVVTSQGGGGGATPAPCDLWATFTWSQEKKSKAIIFDPTGSTPDPNGSCSNKITSYAWTWDDTTYLTDDPSVLPSTFDVTETTLTTESGPGKNTDNQLFHVALTIRSGSATYTVRQDVLSLSK